MQKALSTVRNRVTWAYEQSGDRRNGCRSVKRKMHLEEKKDFIATRKGILNPNTLSKEERVALIKENRSMAILSAAVR